MAFGKSTSLIYTLAIALMSMAMIVDGINVGFYNGKCKGHNVEKIVFGEVEKRFATDKTIVAALLRMHFHDCFVRGCDASILLNGANTEKTATPNGSVRAFDLIDAAKNAVEAKCPDVVSCADIIVIATRAAVYLKSKHWYNVETGRKDGIFSSASEANSNLLSPSIPVSSAINEFAKRKLDTIDFVLLIGAHTVGVTHCNFVRSSSKNSTLVESLKKTCPKGGASNPVFLDQTPGSRNLVDDGYYRAIEQNKGILEIDQRIATHPLTKKIVNGLNKENFLAKFGEAMVKLGRVPMPDGQKGEIRKSCSAVNAPPASSGGLFKGLF